MFFAPAPPTAASLPLVACEIRPEAAFRPGGAFACVTLRLRDAMADLHGRRLPGPVLMCRVHRCLHVLLPLTAKVDRDHRGVLAVATRIPPGRRCGERVWMLPPGTRPQARVSPGKLGDPARWHSPQQRAPSSQRRARPH